MAVDVKNYGQNPDPSHFIYLGLQSGSRPTVGNTAPVLRVAIHTEMTKERPRRNDE